MNRKNIFCAVSLCALLISGCARERDQMRFLGIEEARRIVLEEAGFLASEVEFIETDLDSRSGIDYYEVKFIASGETYEYDIDALTGVVIDTDLPVTDVQTAHKKGNTAGNDSTGGNGIGKSSDNNTDSGDSTAGSNSTASSNSAADSNNTADGNSTAGGDGAANGNGTASSGNNTANSGDNTAGGNQKAGKKMLTSEEAYAKALAHAGLKNNQATLLKSKQEYEDGNPVYEIEFYSEDHKEYDYEIDAYTGEVLNFDYDVENHTSSSDGTMISIDEAKKLALAQVPGASMQDISEFEVDYDDGQTEYEGKIIYNGMEYEFSIDAYSGTFWSWEAEPEDD